MAGFPGFKVGVTVFLADRASMGLMGITRSIASATGASKALRAELAGLQTAMRVGMGMTIIGGAGLVGIGKMVSDAAEFQMTMTRVLNLFKLTTDQTRQFRDEVFRVSHATIFDPESIARVAEGMKQVGITYQNIAQLLPQAGAAAEILFRTKGIAPLETGRTIGEFAHTLGVYSQAGVGRLEETLVNALQLTPGQPQALIRQLGYMKPAQLMGIPPGNLTPAQLEEARIRTGIAMVDIAAIAQQVTGTQGGRQGGPASGAAVLNFMLGAAGVGQTLTGFAFIQNQLSRAALGFLDPTTGRSTMMAGGAFQPLAAIQHIQEMFKTASTLKGQQQMVQQMVREMAQAHVTKKQADAILNNPLFKGALQGQVQNPGAFLAQLGKMMAGTTGMRAMTVLGDPGTMQALGNFLDQLAHAATIAQQQQAFLDTFQGRWMQMTTDIHKVSIQLGTGLLPVLTRWITWTDKLVERMSAWIALHPVATKRLVALTAAVSGLLVAGGVATMIVTLAAAIKVLGAASAAASAGAAASAAAAASGAAGAGATGVAGAGAGGIVAGIAAILATPEVLAAAVAIATSAGVVYAAHRWGPDLKPLLKLIPTTPPGGPPEPAAMPPAHKKPTAFWTRPGDAPGTSSAGGVHVHPGAVVIHVAGDISGDGTIEKLRRELHAALLAVGGGGTGMYESGFAHAGTIGV